MAERAVDSRASGGTGRWTGAAGLGWGALLLTRGDRLWRGLTGSLPSDAEHRVIAVLAARHLGQGMLQTLAPSRLPRLWLLVDLLHAASMLAVAVLDPARRRPALVSGTVSLLSALNGGRAARRVPGPPPLAPSRRARRSHR